MPLLCELGWHRADPLARWNHGYYFSKCGRCGRDLVRTAFAGWQVPHGFKVVWQAKPPAGAEDVQLVPEQDSPVAAASTGTQAFHDRSAGEAMAIQVPLEEFVSPPAPLETAADIRETVAPVGEAPEETEVAAEVEAGQAEVQPELQAEVETEEVEAEAETDAEAETIAEAEAEVAAEFEEEVEAELPFDAPVEIDEQSVGEENGSTSEAAPQDEELPVEEDPAPPYTSLIDGPEPRTAELPIQEVLRQLQDGEVPERDAEVLEPDTAENANEVAAEAPPEPSPAVGPDPLPPVRVRRGAIPDFMSDDPEEDLLESMSHPPRREHPTVPHEEETGLDEPQDANDWADHQASEEVTAPASVSQVATAAAAAAAPAVAADAPSLAAVVPTGEGRPMPRQKILGERDPFPNSARHGGEGDPTASSGRAKAAVTIAASFGVVMLAAALMARPDMRPSQAAQQPTIAARQAAQPSPTPPQQTAQAKSGAEAEAKAKADAEAEAKRFVTASLLNCRSSPAEEAKPVRRLPRGEPVQVLAMEPAWASVSHKGRQCWASSRYISEQEPL